MKDFLPAHIYKAMKLMENHNFSPFLVGGCVRDYIMGECPHDYDITVSALPEEIISLFESEGYKTDFKGKQFGTVAVYIDDEEIEITPHRTEGDYTDSRHPNKVEFVKDVRLDLSRRDITINAMAMSLDGRILDIFGGLDDIKSKTIRCVGNPAVRFTEDALRILRVIRFASRLGFSLEEETRTALTFCKKLLKNISAERIQDELRRTLCFPYSYNILLECDDVIKEIIPEFKADNFLMCEYGDFPLKLFSCIREASYEGACNICEFLKLPNTESEKIKKLHMLYNSELTVADNKIVFDNAAKISMCEGNADYIKELFVFSGSDMTSLNNFTENGVYMSRQLAVTGGEIASSGLFAKNLTGLIHKKVLHSVSVGEIENTRSAIFDYLKSPDFII